MGFVSIHLFGMGFELRYFVWEWGRDVHLLLNKTENIVKAIFGSSGLTTVGHSGRWERVETVFC